MTGTAPLARRAVLVFLSAAAALTLEAGAVLAARSLPAGAMPGPDPAGLPVVLSSGWRAADGDPPDGVWGIDRLDFRPADPLNDQARREGVRWYRILVDLSPFVGQPLAFAAPGIRDVDEAWFDGVRIGGLGDFPPASDTAHFVSRLYPLPTDRVDSAGPRELVLRVWHGKRDGSVFRGLPVIGRLDHLERERSSHDQSLVLFFGASVVVSMLLVLFTFHARSPADYLLFAGFASALGLYVMMGHSVWSDPSVPFSAVFRGGIVVLVVTAICYCAAMLRFLGAGFPPGYRVLLLAFAVLGVVAPVVPGIESFVIPLQLFRWVFAALLLDLLVRFAVAALRGRRSARTDLLGHVSFLLAALPVAGLVPGTGPADLDPSWRVVLLGLLFLCLASTVLWRMSEEVRRFRLAGLTDAGTRLWNRDALYGEIAERGEALRRGKGRGFGLLLADVDRFREWNHAKGRLAGDRLLLRAARALLDASRPQDFVARTGGDEFAVVLGEVDGETLPALASRLREALGAALSAETGGFLSSASVGTELFDAARHGTPEDLLRDVDRKLYEAKEAIRAGNPVRTARQTPSGKWSVRL
jgi:diguanylate cyclase (GGDEF)-like protein